MLRRLRSLPVIGSLVALVLVLAPTAAADHTNPRTPLAPTNGATTTGLVRGEGTWRHIANFPGGASNALTGGGTDLEFFSPAGSADVYGAFGTLGQDERFTPDRVGDAIWDAATQDEGDWRTEVPYAG